MRILLDESLPIELASELSGTMSLPFRKWVGLD